MREAGGEEGGDGVGLVWTPVAGAPFFVLFYVVVVVMFFFFCIAVTAPLFHIMLFCREFTSEEFSSPPSTLWFSCLGVRELWMLRESSSLVGAFIGSSSLFWELGSSCPKGGVGSEGVREGEELSGWVGREFH